MTSANDTRRLQDQVQEFAALLERGDTVGAMSRFYAEDVCVFENRELARAGRDTCIRYEQAQLQRHSGLEFRMRRWAVNEATAVAFLEYVVRFIGEDGRPMRIEQVAVQQWHQGQISEERFYYEGLVDEGD